MPGLPQSPRKRRRLAYAGSAALAISLIALVSAVIGNSSGPKEAPIHEGQKAQVYEGATPRRATAAEKHAAAKVLTAFAASAIPRRHLAISWELATPHMREGTTREEWLAGSLPVVPYPAARFGSIGLTFKGAYVGGVIDYDVLVLPRTKGGQQQVYSCELRNLAEGWRVDFCYPRAVLG
ncbi:MAG TPA: hypothetical protein VLN26_17800 [Gaiellaceae bacterium]|nr:hypothetical protein [Gaiellaceae bacterium]